MFVTTSSKANRLLLLTYIGHVRLEELTRERKSIEAMLADLLPGFRTLSDFSRFESMDGDCIAEIGSMMEILDGAGMSMVVRVIPDPRQDPGFNILSAFHYKNRPQVVTCNNLLEAGKLLSL